MVIEYLKHFELETLLFTARDSTQLANIGMVRAMLNLVAEAKTECAA